VLTKSKINSGELTDKYPSIFVASNINQQSAVFVQFSWLRQTDTQISKRRYNNTGIASMAGAQAINTGIYG